MSIEHQPNGEDRFEVSRGGLDRLLAELISCREAVDGFSEGSRDYDFGTTEGISEIVADVHDTGYFQRRFDQVVEVLDLVLPRQDGVDWAAAVESMRHPSEELPEELFDQPGPGDHPYIDHG